MAVSAAGGGNAWAIIVSPRALEVPVGSTLEAAPMAAFCLSAQRVVGCGAEGAVFHDALRGVVGGADHLADGGLRVHRVRHDLREQGDEALEVRARDEAGVVDDVAHGLVHIVAAVLHRLLPDDAEVLARSLIHQCLLVGLPLLGLEEGLLAPVPYESTLAWFQARKELRVAERKPFLRWLKTNEKECV
jgi:hypothetical protein